MKEITTVTDPLELPCGATLQNRLIKAAMTERFSFSDYLPNEQHVRLYQMWAKGGAGCLITGNVMVEKSSLESAGNVVALPEGNNAMRAWSAAATQFGNHCWVQLSHSGRQTSVFNNLRPVAPSAIKLKRMGFFAKPRALSEVEIDQVIEKFVSAAVLCADTGFTGIQIHAAHGYLLSQFLSPTTNQRTDKWGGTIKNRSRILFEIIERCRTALGQSFPISVKINSSDFQRGGFSEEESLWVVKELNKSGIDLLEISGGTYENAVFLVDENLRESTRKREAYFIEFARKVKKITSVPIMVTGGIRSREFADEALTNSWLDAVGIARPFLLDTNFAQNFFNGASITSPRIRTGFKKFEDMAEAGYYNLILDRLGRGKDLKTNFSPIRSAAHLIKHEFVKSTSKKLRF